MMRKLQETFVVVWYDSELTPISFAKDIKSYDDSLGVGEQGLKDIEGTESFNIEKYYKLSEGNAK